MLYGTESAACVARVSTMTRWWFVSVTLVGHVAVFLPNFANLQKICCHELCIFEDLICMVQIQIVTLSIPAKELQLQPRHCQTHTIKNRLD